MKKLYYGLLVVLCSTLFFASCSDDEDENKSDDVINGSIYGTWYRTLSYGEDEDGAFEEEHSVPLYYAFYEDGTGKCQEGEGTLNLSMFLDDFTWTCNGRNLTLKYERYDDENFYIRKLTADELVLYNEYYVDNEDWGRWCDVYVRVDKEL